MKMFGVMILCLLGLEGCSHSSSTIGTTRLFCLELPAGMDPHSSPLKPGESLQKTATGHWEVCSK